jgi:hypothetical protein
MRNKQWRELKQNLLKSGVTVLENESVTIDGVHFFGLNGASLKNQTLENLVLKEGCNVLLAHDPRYFKRYCAKGFDLVLCGHAHGGQFRIPFTKRGVYAPGLGLLPTYCMGSYSDGRTTMIVSRGLGNSEFPLRLFNPPEVVTVRITAQK